MILFKRVIQLLLAATSIALVLSLPVGVLAQDGRFEEGYKAYQQQDYTNAFYYWKPLADDGDARAEYNLAIMYLFGHGVPQSTVEAYKWFLLARDNHNNEADKAIIQLEGKMTAHDMGEGLRLRDEWHRKHGY